MGVVDCELFSATIFSYPVGASIKAPFVTFSRAMDRGDATLYCNGHNRERDHFCCGGLGDLLAGS